jgi:hypothetical protein
MFCNNYGLLLCRWNNVSLSNSKCKWRTIRKRLKRRKKKGGKLPVDLANLAKIAISPVLGKDLAELVRGERVLREVESLMPRLEAMMRGEDFDPARSWERFRVAMTDHASMILLPSLAARVRRAATHVKLEVSTWRTQAYEDVAAGRIDTALSAEEAPPALESEVLFNLDFVCLVGSAQLRKKLEKDSANPTYLLTDSYIGYRSREP